MRTILLLSCLLLFACEREQPNFLKVITIYELQNQTEANDWTELQDWRKTAVVISITEQEVNIPAQLPTVYNVEIREGLHILTEIKFIPIK